MGRTDFYFWSSIPSGEISAYAKPYAPPDRSLSSSQVAEFGQERKFECAVEPLQSGRCLITVRAIKQEFQAYPDARTACDEHSHQEAVRSGHPTRAPKF